MKNSPTHPPTHPPRYVLFQNSPTHPPIQRPTKHSIHPPTHPPTHPLNPGCDLHRCRPDSQPREWGRGHVRRLHHSTDFGGFLGQHQERGPFPPGLHGLYGLSGHVWGDSGGDCAVPSRHHGKYSPTHPPTHPPTHQHPILSHSLSSIYLCALRYCLIHPPTHPPYPTGRQSHSN